MTETTKKYIHLAAISHIYSLSPATLYRWRKRAEKTDDPFPLPVRTVLNRKLYRAADIDAWIERNIAIY